MSYQFRELLLISDDSTSHLEKRVLLCFIAQKPLEYLLSHPDHAFSDEEYLQYKNYLHRLQKGEPLAYIIQEKEFYNRQFYVDNRVLIPRPETEGLVDMALNKIKSISSKKNCNPRIIDLGTGSGAIAITLCLELKNTTIMAVDICEQALEVCKKNKASHKADLVSVCQSNGLKSIPTDFFDTQALVIIANLPYLSTDEQESYPQSTLNFEPHRALFAGKDGLDIYREVWSDIQSQQIDCDFFAGEIAYNQGESALQTAREFFPEAFIKIHQDLAGLDRYISIE